MKIKTILSVCILLASTMVCGRDYVGKDFTPGGSVGIIDLTDEYQVADYISVNDELVDATDGGLYLTKSTLTVIDATIYPDADYGYDGNIAVVSHDFSPAIFDGFTQNWNKLGQPCQVISDLSLGRDGVVATDNCYYPNDDIAYGIIFINTNSPLYATGPDGTQFRNYLLKHELLHQFGFLHAPLDNCVVYEASTTIMNYSAYPHQCGYYPTTFGDYELDILAAKYK